jgi:hypothetical protein
MTQKCKLIAKYGTGRSIKPDDIIAMEWTNDDHTPWSTNPGAYTSCKAFAEIVACPENNFVEIKLVETLEKRGGKGPRSRTIHVTLEKQFADMLANHILYGKFKQEG